MNELKFDKIVKSNLEDIAVIEYGIIEGNNYPSYDFPQFPEFAVDKVGTWKKYKEIIKELK